MKKIMMVFSLMMLIMGVFMVAHRVLATENPNETGSADVTSKASIGFSTKSIDDSEGKNTTVPSSGNGKKTAALFPLTGENRGKGLLFIGMLLIILLFGFKLKNKGRA